MALRRLVVSGDQGRMMKDYQALYAACRLQAQIWKQEARCANHTIAQIYQLVTGNKGEPGNWNGAEPVKALVAERDALRAEIAQLRTPHAED